MRSKFVFSAVHIYVGDKSSTEALGDRPGTSHSQVGQDKLISSILHCKQKGLFLDVAANDALSLSNTRSLERDLAWDGICVEANPEYWPKLARRECKLFGAVLGQETGQKVQFVSRRWASGISGPEYDNKNGGYPEITVTIRDLLEFSKAPTVIDYFSFDVEGAESIIAKAFPWETTHITTMTVERPKPDAVELFQEHGMQYLRKNSNFNDQTWIDSGIQDRDTIMADFGDSVKDLKLTDCRPQPSNQVRAPGEPLPHGWKVMHIFAEVHSENISSNNPEDAFLAGLLCMKSGYFVEISSQATASPSTSMLETRGWEGLCVGSNPSYWKARAGGRCTIVELRPQADIALEKVFEDMQTPRSIQYVIGEAADLEQFPWKRYRVSVVMVSRPSETVTKLLQQEGYFKVNVPGGGTHEVWTAKDAADAGVCVQD